MAEQGRRQLSNRLLMWHVDAYRTLSSMNVPVLIVGAGPAGLAAALELARHDVPALLVERRTRLSSHPRATVLSLRSMELVRAWGLEAAVRGHSVEVDWRMLVADTLAQAGAGEMLPVGYPSTEQSRVLSPVAPACIAQDAVEPLLASIVPAVSLGTEVTGVVLGSGSARVQLRDVRTGAARTVHAEYVVAADGARSTLRRALGIPLVGPDRVLEGFTSLFHAPLWDVVGDRRHVIYSVNAAGTFIPTGRSDRWLFGTAGSAPDAGTVAELIRVGAGVPDLPVRVERSRDFSSAAQIAERWRCGPVFLAGDAAHRVTPRGGTGLNIALHDGYDLGWRLAWVLRGWESPDLLDGYEAERRPVAEHTVARSADPQGSIRPVEGEVRADLGGRIAHAWVGDRSTLDLLAPGLTLFAAHGRPAPPSRAPVTVRAIGPIAARAIGAPGDGALLVRSDGTPVAVLPRAL
jgi:putative polyketide hydroxylase